MSERILITGASSGIGLATAVAFAERGGHVALLARSRPGLVAAARKVEAAGGTAEMLECDVTDRERLGRAVAEAFQALGGLDFAIVNAGAAAYGYFSATAAEDFDRTIDVTFRGAVDTIRAVFPYLETDGGRIIVVGSVAGRIPLPSLSAYTAAKHGLRGFVDALNLEIRAGRSSVSVAMVSPGPVNTPFWDNVATQEGRLPPHLPGAYPPSDVATAVVACAYGRRSNGLTVGGAMTALTAAHSIFNPLSEILLIRLARWARGAGELGSGQRAIHSPAGRGEIDGPLEMSRPSLVLRGFSNLRALAKATSR